MGGMDTSVLARAASKLRKQQISHEAKSEVQLPSQ